MNIHEYQAKELLANFGVPVPAGFAALSVDEAVAASKQLPGPLYLTGAGAPLLAPFLDGLTPEIVDTAEAPDIADVAWLGATAELGLLPVPLYLRGADAKPQIGRAVARL